MTWGAVGAIGSIAAPIIGGMLSGDAAQSAAQTQADASNQAAQLQQQRYLQTRQDLMPYMQEGPMALSNLNALMGFGPVGGMGGGFGAGGSAVGGAAGAQGLLPSPGVATPAAAPSAAGTGMMIDPRTGQIYDPSSFATGKMASPIAQAKMAAQQGGGLVQRGGQWGISTPNQPNVFGTVNANPQFRALQPYTPSGTAAATPTAATPSAAGPGGAAGAAGGGFSRDAMMNALTANPAYQFNLQQGQQAINRGAAARGMYYAPTTLQDLGTYAQGMASQEYGNIWNRLFSMAGMGQNAATQTGQFGAAAAGAQGGLMTDAARAQAGGIIGQNQAYGGMIGGVTGALNNPQTQQWLQSLYGGGSGVSAAFGGNAGIF